MKKKLYVDNVDSVFHIGDIHFSFKRLYKYIGLNTTDVVFMDDSIKTEILNDSIEIEKIIKSEKIDLNTKCNYEIKSKKLDSILLKRAYIRLNTLELVYFYFWKHPSRLMWAIGSIVVPILLTVNFKPHPITNHIDSNPEENAINHIMKSSKPVNDSLSDLDSIKFK